MGKLVVSDTNIFIDLIHMGLLGDFFLLPFDITTVDFVIRELKKAGQKEAVLDQIVLNNIIPANLVADKLEELSKDNKI